MPFIAIVSIQDLLVCHIYEADAPVQYGGSWGDPNSHVHIQVPEGLDSECLMAVRDDTTAGQIELRSDPEKVAAKQGRNWLYIRAERNRRLAETDWTRIDDAPLTEAERAAWQSYRQVLRDFPGTLSAEEIYNLSSIVWPAKPE